MNNSVMLDGPKYLHLSPQSIAVIIDCLAEGKFKVVNPVIAEIMQQLKNQEPKTKEEVSREEINCPVPCDPGIDGMQFAQPADR